MPANNTTPALPPNCTATAACRPTFSRENPPPPPAGFVLAAPGAAMCIGDRVYNTIHGWQSDHIGFVALEDADENFIAFARPALIETPEPPHGYALYTPVHDEQAISGRYQVGGGDGWFSVHNYVPLSPLAPHPVARRELPLGDLPFLEVPGPSKHGDLVYDTMRSVSTWMPWVGPEGMCLTHLHQSFDWPLALARLRPELVAETHHLLGFHTELDRNHEILIREGEVYVWRPVEEDGPDDGHFAYMREHIFGVRKLRSTTTRCPVGQFLSRHLLNILQSDPGSNLFRGLIRSEHHLVIPRALQNAADPAAIQEFLETEYARVHPMADDAPPSLIRVSHRTRHTRPAGRLTRIPPDTAPVRFSFYDDVGGTANFSATDYYSGTIHVPLAVLRDGGEATRDWVEAHRHDPDSADTNRSMGDRDYNDETIDEVSFNEMDELRYEEACEAAHITPPTEEPPIATTTTNLAEF